MGEKPEEALKNALQKIVGRETDLDWSAVDDTPILYRFTAVNYVYKAEWSVGNEKWRITFEDKSTGDEEAIGPIQTDDLVNEFEIFVSETASKYIN